MSDISEEYRAMLSQLYDDEHPQRQPGEFTCEEYYEINRKHFDNLELARKGLDYLVRSGKVEKCGLRYIDQHMRKVYKIVQVVTS